MAARRALSLIATKMSQTPVPRVSRKFHPARSFKQYIRGLQSAAEATGENKIKPDTSISNPSASKCTAAVSETNPTSSPSSMTHPRNSKVRVSQKRDLAMIFSCKACEARSIKTVCRESHQKGVVIARCDACNNLHVISDRLGWFGGPGSAEEYLAARGEEVEKGSVESTFNFVLLEEDAAGKKEDV